MKRGGVTGRSGATEEAVGPVEVVFGSTGRSDWTAGVKMDETVLGMTMLPVDSPRGLNLELLAWVR